MSYKQTAADLTTWGSVNAEDMFQIATKMAGFDPIELMKEIHRRTMRSSAFKVNESTVLNAMGTLDEASLSEEEKADRDIKRAGILESL